MYALHAQLCMLSLSAAPDRCLASATTAPSSSVTYQMHVAANNVHNTVTSICWNSTVAARIRQVCLQKHDKKGPMLFHHIKRQPLTIGLQATEDLHRIIDREDEPVWQCWVTSLRQRMRQYSMPQEEAHYIFRFEHYRFWLPHSSSALVRIPSFPCSTRRCMSSFNRKAEIEQQKPLKTKCRCMHFFETGSMLPKVVAL